MKNLYDLQAAIPEIEQRLGYLFMDKSPLIMAFIHRSFVNENKSVAEQHNERLEFLGDSVLGLLISDYLYKYLPMTPEGELSYLRSRLVEASSCMQYVQKLGVEEFLLLGKGERRNDGRGRESILADLFEAIVGAIFIDGGLESARRFLFQSLSKEFESILKKPDENWKAILQDYAQKKYQQTPVYEVVSETGPDHNKMFIVKVMVKDREMGRGEGASKKEAQQKAAENAVQKVTIHGKS